MTSRIGSAALVAGVAVSVLLVAGCGGSSKSGATSATDGTPPPDVGQLAIRLVADCGGTPCVAAVGSPRNTKSAATSADSSTAAVPSDGAPPDDPIAWASNPGATWQARFASYDCLSSDSADKAAAADPSEPLLACGADAHTKYLLSSVVIDGSSVGSASADIPPGQVGWAVNVTLKGTAVQVFADISRALLANGGLAAILVGGQVVSAPAFSGVITDGSLQITGSLTQSSAEHLAQELGAH